MEIKGKFKRDLVKNILIVFLIIMLGLTFFSNTILNRSLPEVSTQYASYKQINDNIKATATVSANQDYIIISDESREIASVEVARGDRVERGQVIYTLVPNESNELSEAEKALNLLLIQKEQMLKEEAVPDSSDIDYELEQNNEKIAEYEKILADYPEYESTLDKLEEELEVLTNALEEQNERLSDLNGRMSRYESTYESIAEITALLEENKKIFEEADKIYVEADLKVEEKEAGVEALELANQNIQEEIDKCDEKISEYSKKKLEYDDMLASVTQGNNNALTLQAALEEAQTSLYSIEREYHYFGLYKEAERAYTNASEEEAEALRTAYIQAKEDYESVSGGEIHDEKYYLDIIDTRKLAVSRAEAAYTDSLNLTGEEKKYGEKVTYYEGLIEKYELEKTDYNKSIEKNNKQIAALQKEITKLSESYTEAKLKRDESEALVKSLESRLEYAKLRDDAKLVEDKVKKQNKAIKEKEEEIDEYTENYPGDIKDAKQQIKALKHSNEVLEKEKAELGKVDVHDEEIKRLELINLEKDIARQQEEITRIKSKLVTTELTSPVSGVITSLNYSAGEDIEGGSEVASVAISEKGYTMEFSVTNEQAQRIKVGDLATVQNYYWGSAPEIRVSAIKNDTSNPGRGKIVVLSLTGDDITVGQSLSFTLGERARSYDKVVPNSALREDSNGKFVLVVQSKSTPLGTRYTAKRVEVEVIASDETSSALSGELLGGEFIITTASSPVSDGMQVRLSDEK